MRRGYLTRIADHTGRNVILYATAWTQPLSNLPPEILSITDADMVGMMEVVHGLRGDALDLILHSPGGSPTAAENIVEYLRSKFTSLRVFVPHAAMSAATMISCAADRVVMGRQSSLGPIDPQLPMMTDLGGRLVPAQAILSQFERAKQECEDPRRLAAWAPMLRQYGPDLLIQCENVSRLSKELVHGWLRRWMFKDYQPNPREEAAEALATWLARHDEFGTHGRHVMRHTLRERGMLIDDLEADQTLQDLVLSAYHATTHSFGMAGVMKIIENHQGKSFVNAVRIAMPPQGGPPPAQV